MNYIIANNIRSAYNVGSLFRIADALNLSLILQGFTPHPRVKNDTRPRYIIKRVEKKIKKSAVRTFDYVDCLYFKKNQDVMSFAKKEGVTLYSLENLESAYNIYTMKKSDISSSFALIIGNEVKGVDEYFLKNSKQTLKIPMYGKNPSLNVSVSTGIALYHLYHLLT